MSQWTLDMLRQLFAEYSDEQLAQFRVSLAEIDAIKARRAACRVCHGVGVVDASTMGDGVYRQFEPCSACGVEPTT